MKLKKLTIEWQAEWRSENPNRYIALLEYEDKKQNVSLTLDPDVSERILAFIGPVLSASARQVTLEMEKNLALSLEEAKKLPAIDLQ